MKTFIVLACLMATAIAFDLDLEWNRWRSQHQKLYSSAHHDIRKAIFGDNLRFIQQHNARFAQGLESYEVGLNKHADLTNYEFSKKMFGLAKTAGHQGEVIFKYNASVVDDDEVDWRKKGVVTEVKDQQECGSCFSFSATGAIEGAHALASKKLVSLSEQQILDCDPRDTSPCENGGLMDHAFAYVKEANGIETEASYPYTAEDGDCQFDKSKVAAHITGFVDVQKFDENALKQAVAKTPVSVAIWADFPGFRFYKSGVLVAKEGDCPDGQLDHGVLAVGYGTLNNKDYWLIKNSWGSDWGKDGYVYFARNHNNMCGVASYASFPTV